MTMVCLEFCRYMRSWFNGVVGLMNSTPPITKYGFLADQKLSRREYNELLLNLCKETNCSIQLARVLG
jgi:hypothetical protein